MKKILIVNTGSASVKYGLYEGEAELSRAHFEMEDGSFVVTLTVESKTERKQISVEDYKNSLEYLLEYRKLDGSDLEAAGVRIVSPGDYFLCNRQIDGDYIERLSEKREEAPLHIEPVLEMISKIREKMPSLPLYGISDSAFHSSLPAQSRQYAIPYATASQHEIYRYGYHGISIQSVLHKAEKMLGALPAKIIVCHLGSGASITAVKDGNSFDTSMGYTPLEGLVMATRGGDIDPGVIVHLAEKLGLDHDDMKSYLNNECGLLGLSGKSNDVRELLKLEKGGDTHATLALEAWVYRIKKYIGAYTAALNGLDLLIFTATIGERSFVMRGRILKELDILGISVDEANNNATENNGALINTPDSKVKIAVIPTDEMAQMARDTRQLMAI